MYLDQDKPDYDFNNSLADGETTGQDQKSPCEKIMAGEAATMFETLKNWAKANKDWLPWAVAAGASAYAFGKRKSS